MEEPNSKKKKTHSIDEIIDKVLQYLTDPEDRASASMVCRSWKKADGETREHVTMDLCYAASPDRLSRRFPNLKHLKLTGKPRPDLYYLLPENWGGYASPWVNEIAISKFQSLKSVHFKQMIVSDLDLEVLAKSRLDQLVALKLRWCSGFSTDGLLCITKHCRKIETLILDTFLENDDAWLHELALHNTSLKVLNFYLTKLDHLNPVDLETLAMKCRSLVSVKIVGDFDILKLVGFFKAATNLEEFFGGCFNMGLNDTPNKYTHMSFPQTLRRLGNWYMALDEMPLIFPIATNIRELDLAYACLDNVHQSSLLERCPNLEVLKTTDIIRDDGLQVLAEHCKKLKRLRIERDAEGFYEGVTQIGLSYLAQGCQELEYIAVYVSDIDNDSLQIIGDNLKNLCDFRLVLLPLKTLSMMLPLDNGVKSLLIGCKKLKRFGLYLIKGGLTDEGMDYIGQYSENVRWMLLGHVGDSDEGLIALSKGCAKLQKLEMRWCPFTDRAIATAVMNLPSLKYIWNQNCGTAEGDLSLMTCPFWNIERIPSRITFQENELGELDDIEIHSQLLAYYSLDDKRTDYPNTVLHLGRPINFFQ